MLTMTRRTKLVITLPAMVSHTSWMSLTKLKLMVNANSQQVKMELKMTTFALSMQILLVKIRSLTVMNQMVFMYQLWLVKIPILPCQEFLDSSRVSLMVSLAQADVVKVMDVVDTAGEDTKVPAIITNPDIVTRTMAPAKNATPPTKDNAPTSSNKDVNKHTEL